MLNKNKEVPQVFKHRKKKRNGLQVKVGTIFAIRNHIIDLDIVLLDKEVKIKRNFCKQLEGELISSNMVFFRYFFSTILFES